ncbi:MAG: flagellar export chaperone FliS [Proteobacteria bacterium]|nr:MAG: flagellar export chaperone FliS [Pseudomonadota bacterium]
MSTYSRASSLAAYQSAAAHGGVAASDPHRLIVMLMDGALERIHGARGCIERGELGEKARLINRAVSIVGELRGSLDMSAGGQIAHNLSDLYEYICHRLLKATSDNDIAILDEAARLLGEIRDAWLAIPQEARQLCAMPG